MSSESGVSLLAFDYKGVIEQATQDGTGLPKTVGFTTTISKDCSQEELDGLIDKCRRAVARQVTFVEIDKVLAHLRELQGGIGLKYREISLEDKQFAKRAEEHPGRAERGLSATEREKRRKDLEGLEVAALNKKGLEEKLARLRAMVGQDEPPMIVGAHTNGERQQDERRLSG
jgi:hypothetical protein